MFSDGPLPESQKSNHVAIASRPKTLTGTLPPAPLVKVRDEIVKERKERESTFITSESSTHFGGRLPQIRGESGGGDRNGGSRSSRRRQGPSMDRVDLKDLGWEDKERVLRLLFAKINQSGGQGGASTHSAQSTRLGHGGVQASEEEGGGERV